MQVVYIPLEKEADHFQKWYKVLIANSAAPFDSLNSIW